MSRSEATRVRLSKKEKEMLEFVQRKAAFPTESETIRYCIRLVHNIHKQKEEGEK